MGLFDFLEPLEEIIRDVLIKSGMSVPPGSVLVLVFVSVLISAFSGFVNRTVLDMEKLTRDTQEMMEHSRNKKMAMETEDKKLWIRVKRNEERFLELQKNTTMTRMLPSLITIGPFIFLFQTLRGAFQKNDNLILNSNSKLNGGNCSSSCGVTAVLPFKIHDISWIGNWFSPYAYDTGLSVAGFGFWYFLSAVVISTIMQRILGINITGMKNPMQQI